MYFQVVFVLDNEDHCGNVLAAWEDAGIRGVTILESSGLGRVHKAGLRAICSRTPKHATGHYLPW